MASSSASVHFFLLLIAIFLVPCLSESHEPNPKPRPIILPIKEDPATNMFYTTLGIGTPRHNMDLVIHLSGENLWHICNTSYKSSSYHLVECESQNCPKDSICSAIGCNVGTSKEDCEITTCDITITNPVSQFIFISSLGKDVIFIPHVQVPNLLAACIDLDIFTAAAAHDLLLGLPKSSKGIKGLSRSQLALPKQLILAYMLPPKFALCLPSSNFGNIFIGGDVESKFLCTTPMITNPVSTGAVFPLIKIDGHVLNLKPSLMSINKKGNRGAKLVP